MAKRLGTRRALIVGLMVLGLIAAFVGGAYGYHQFSDVPTNDPYHADISWLANAGITSGCGSGKFCPDDSLKREQMAKFLHLFATRTRTGHFSCDTYSFTPATSGQTFGLGGGGAQSDGPMSCAIDLPDNATITKFSATFFDNNASFNEGCTLYREGQYVGAINAYSAMASVTTTSASATSQRLSTTSITNPIVDNNNYSYISYCTFGTNSSDLVLFGVIIEYSYTGIPAP